MSKVESVPLTYLHFGEFQCSVALLQAQPLSEQMLFWPFGIAQKLKDKEEE